MLSGLTVTNFKCFQNRTSFQFGQFNLLTGANGTGKSSALQPLLCMWQSIDWNPAKDTVTLSGSAVDLGSFKNVRNANNTDPDPIIWEFAFSEGPAKVEVMYALESASEVISAALNPLYDMTPARIVGFEFRDLGSSERHSNIKIPAGLMPGYEWHQMLPVSKREPNIIPPDVPSRIINFNRIHYVSADRLGPQNHYRRHAFGRFENVGACGEDVGGILHFEKNSPVKYPLLLGREEKIPPTLRDQTEAWLARLFGCAKVETNVTSANTIELEIGADASEYVYRPKNVGFGYTAALPIIVSCLIAEEGDILIIENPEAHLHPAAQSALMQLLMRVTKIGVQVFVETHSDHILNSLRVGIKNGVIPDKDVSLYYFTRTDEAPIRIAIREDGKIETWPYNFFDQLDKDYFELFGI